jgi:hypothetical protein
MWLGDNQEVGESGSAMDKGKYVYYEELLCETAKMTFKNNSDGTQSILFGAPHNINFNDLDLGMKRVAFMTFGVRLYFNDGTVRGVVHAPYMGRYSRQLMVGGRDVTDNHPYELRALMHYIFNTSENAPNIPEGFPVMEVLLTRTGNKAAHKFAGLRKVRCLRETFPNHRNIDLDLDFQPPDSMLPLVRLKCDKDAGCTKCSVSKLMLVLFSI